LFVWNIFCEVIQATIPLKLPSETALASWNGRLCVSHAAEAPRSLPLT